jgi:hypothetical protein
VTDEVLRNYIGVLSFLLAALSFLANERRESIALLHTRSDVGKNERLTVIATVILLFLVALGLVATAIPAVFATSLGPGDLLRLASGIREAFVLGWLLLVAITVALGALVGRAWTIETTSA